jgi:hypothetical protein
MCECLTVQKIVQWEARKRIPDEFKGLSYFGAYDIWHYIDTTSKDPVHGECETCHRFHAYTFTGNTLRSYFPDLTVEAENLINPNVHKTLWGTDTCKCYLIRVTGNPDYSNDKVLQYMGPKIEPYKPKKKDELDAEESATFNPT